MAPRNDAIDLAAAWRALQGSSGGVGWHTIPIILNDRCHVRAGRRFPEDEEAILVGLRIAPPPSESKLPQGKGFSVRSVALPSVDSSLSWLALVRNDGESIELFSLMAEDIVGVLENGTFTAERQRLEAFLDRVRSWQFFMERDRTGLLTPEAEIGLFGELSIVEALISLGVSPRLVTSAWNGPAGGLHDFDIGAGSIEVKTTLANTGFPAKIFSLEQLDCAVRAPLFVAAVRLAEANAGRNLPDIISDTRKSVSGDSAALRRLNGQLILAGYSDVVEDSYRRTYAICEQKFLHIDDRVECLTRHKVGPAIIKAAYEIDLDLLTADRITPMAMLSTLGVKKWS